jgi:hypothetical protein
MKYIMNAIYKIADINSKMDGNPVKHELDRLCKYMKD